MQNNMVIMKNTFKVLNLKEIILWIISLVVVISSYLLSGQYQLITILAPVVGVTCLIFVAKGHILGQILTVVFSILYAIVSFQFHYYGEMITYLCMTLPIAIVSIISWLKHPYKDKGQVEVAKLTRKSILFLLIATIVVTTVFYFVLSYFNTPNIIFSTISIATSFLAAALMFLRNPYYAIAYMLNDIVLIVLWSLASIDNISYLPMIFCFTMFLINDLYVFYCWKKMQKDQALNK